MKPASALVLAALLAGCSGAGGNAGNAAQANAAAGNAAAAAPHQTLYHDGWAEAWANPAQTQDYFNRQGYRFLEQYKPAEGGVYRSEAVPTPLSDLEIKTPNVAFYTMEGTKDRVDRIVYRLDLVSQQSAAVARDRLATIIKDSFWTLGLPGDEAVAGPLKAGKAASGTVPGAAWSVEPGPMPGGKAGDSRIIVTFSRPDASSAATDQGSK